MSKLQLYITMSQADMKSLVSINEDPNVAKNVIDLRSAVAKIDIPSDEICIFYMLRFTDEGSFITIVRTIHGTPGHHLACWLYVPYDLAIDDSEVANVVKLVARKASRTAITRKDINELNLALSRDYPTTPNALKFGASEGGSYAFRFYGTDLGKSLEDLIGKARFQPYYLQYAGVMLIDDTLVSDVDATNLTAAPFTGRGPASTPVVEPKPNPIETIAKAEPAPEIPSSTIPEPEIEKPISEIEKPEPTQSETISAEVEPVQSETMQPNPEPAQTEPIVTDWSATSAQGIKSPTPTQKPEESTGFQFPWDRPVAAPRPKQNTSSDHGATSVVEEPKQEAKDEPKSDLPQRQKVYSFVIPTKSIQYGSMIEFDITSNNDISSSPIDGYEATGPIREGMGRTNQLMYTGTATNSLINKLIWGIAGFLIGTALTLLCTCSRNVEANEESAEESQQTAVVDTAAAAQPAVQAAQSSATPAKPQPQSATLADAVQYLDSNHRKWTKEELEQYPDLHGLYDDLNNINRDRIVNYWGPKLKESRRFQSIVTHANNNKKPRRQPYNTNPDNNSISIQDYLNTIDP